MLAAAVPARDGDAVLELGCGAGVASLCLATRVSACRVVGVEILGQLVEQARENARANHLEQRLEFIHADALNPLEELRREFDHVFCNPPFHGAAGQVSPDDARALALQDAGRLGQWLTAALKRVRANGTMTAIIRADRLSESLENLPSRGVSIFPLWPRAGEAAKRVILAVCKSSHTPLALLPGLILHDGQGCYTNEAEEILRNGASLALGSRRL